MGIWILILGFKELKERTEEQRGLTLIVHFIELSIKKELTEFIQTILLVPLGEYLSKSFCPVQESISTCRFAQRVAMIKNDVLLNEEIDPKLVSFWHTGFYMKIEIKLGKPWTCDIFQECWWCSDQSQERSGHASKPQTYKVIFFGCLV